MSDDEDRIASIMKSEVCGYKKMHVVQDLLLEMSDEDIETHFARLAQDLVQEGLLEE